MGNLPGTVLFARLQPWAGPEQAEFPSTAHHLSGELRRLSPILRQQGVHLQFDERLGHNRDRIVSIQFDQLGADADSRANSNRNKEEDDLTPSPEKSDDSASASDRGGQTPERDTFDL